jgi:excisionase family DNA binding protein
MRLDDARLMTDLTQMTSLSEKVRMDQEELLTAEEAQRHLGVSRATFWNLIKRYRVPKYRLPLRGKRVFFKRADLNRLFEPVRVDTSR